MVVTFEDNQCLNCYRLYEPIITYTTRTAPCFFMIFCNSSIYFFITFLETKKQLFKAFIYCICSLLIFFHLPRLQSDSQIRVKEKIQTIIGTVRLLLMDDAGGSVFLFTWERLLGGGLQTGNYSLLSKQSQLYQRGFEYEIQLARLQFKHGLTKSGCLHCAILKAFKRF